MRVLWFTCTPCGASDVLGKPLEFAGWLPSLESGIAAIESIELHVSFYHPTPMKPFLLNKVWYHPVYRGANLLQKIRRKFDKGAQIEAIELDRLCEVVNSVSPDLIHIHGTEENFGLIQERTPIPVVISMQGILTPICDFLFSGISRCAAFKLAPLKTIISRGFGYQFWLKAAARERQILKKCQWILGRTDWDRRVTSILAPQAKYLHGGELLRPSFYEHQWLPSNRQDVFQIVSIISGGMYKGFELILKAAHILTSSKCMNFEWIVIGLSPSSDYVHLSESKLGYKSQNVGIRLVGRKKENEVVDLLINANLFCHASHIENSPNSVCEAMLLGVPVIATFAGGTDSLVRHREEGILVQTGDAHSLAGAILEMATNPDQALAMAQAGKRAAIPRHDKETVIAEILKSYRIAGISHV